MFNILFKRLRCRFSAVLALFICSGMNIEIRAQEITEPRAIQLIHESVPQELKNSFDTAVSRKDHAVVANIYRAIDFNTKQAVQSFSAGASQRSQAALQNEKRRYMDFFVRHIQKNYSANDMHLLYAKIPINQPVFKAVVERMHNQKIKNSREEQATARRIREEQAMACQRRYKIFGIAAAVIGAVGGLLWWWNKQ